MNNGDTLGIFAFWTMYMVAQNCIGDCTEKIMKSSTVVNIIYDRIALFFMMLL